MGSEGTVFSTTTVPDIDEEIGEGFRPTDTELATHYLKRMLQGYYCLVAKIPVVDIYKYEPWDLPYLSGLSLSRSEWYFFCPRHYVNGSRSSRLTKEGFWKSTGKDRVIKEEAKRDILFKKKSLVYHKGRSGRGNRTNWVIHEIRATLDDGATQGAYVLCKVIKKPDKNVKMSTDSEGKPSSRMAPENDHLWTEGNSEFSAPTCCERNCDGPMSTFGEANSRSSSYIQADNVEDEQAPAADFETSYDGENNSSYTIASYTTNPEEVMVEQQPAVSFIGYNKQRYGLNPIPESFATPEFGELSVSGASGFPAKQRLV